MENSGTFWLPRAASTYAADVDGLFYFIFWTSVVIFALVVFGLIYLSIRYKKRGKTELTASISHNTKLEVTWTVLPTLLILVVFVWGFRGYMKMRVVPKDAIEIRVTAQKWFWSFDYQEGINSVGELVVPAGKPIKLLISSRDVIHSLFVPDFRLKMDAVPNRYTIAWFQADDLGEYQLYCTEYCGTEHSKMLGKVRVLSQGDYENWINENSQLGQGLTLEEFGRQVYENKGCMTCHSTDGSARIGPTFKGVFGHEVKLASGETVVVDENYIRESILNPQAKVVAGFQPVMPPYQGILKPQEVDALIAFIKSLKE